MTRWLTAITAAIVLTVSPARGETVIKLATFAPVNSAYHDILLELAREWRDISKGEVVLRIYAGGVAGDEGDMLRKMRVGQLHAATMTAGGLPDIDPDFRAFQVPRMFDELDEFDHVLRQLRPTLDGLMKKRGFRSLGWTTVGWLHFFSREPVRVPDDLRPQRIFVWAGADRFVETWRSGGFRPVQMLSTDLHTALQSKLLDAIAVPPLAALANQWFPLVPHMSTVRWAPMLAAFVISERGWSMVPQRMRPDLAAATDRASNRFSQLVQDYSDQSIAIMRDHGLTVVEASPADIEIWRHEVKRVFHPLIGDYINARLVGEIQGLIDAYRASH
jgi:TRAP-type C4-dicarboxylate transport system substrate-binding protein